MQGLSASVRQDVLLGPHYEGGAHLLNALKFVAARFSRAAGHAPSSTAGGAADDKEREARDKDGKDKQRGVLGALGGAWVSELDGGDPERYGLRRTAGAGLRRMKTSNAMGSDVRPVSGDGAPGASRF